MGSRRRLGRLLCCAGLVFCGLAAGQTEPATRAPNYDFFDARLSPPEASRSGSKPAVANEKPAAQRPALPKTLANLRAPLTPPSSTSPETIARNYLRQLLGPSLLRTASPFELPLVSRSESNEGTLIHLNFQPRHSGIAFFDSNVQVHIDNQGRVWRVHLPNQLEFPSLSPVALGPRQAIEAAIKVLRPGLNLHLQQAEPEQGPGRRTAFADPAWPAPIPIRLVWFPLHGAASLAWEFYLEMPRDGAYWLAVDASNGAILYSHNLAHEAEPSGRVFRAPDTAHPDEGAPSQEPFTGWPAATGPCPAEIYPSTSSGESRCWVHGSETLGNNVDACLDLDGNNLCDGRAFDDEAQFSYPFSDSFSLGNGPAADRLAALANAFYWTNVIHDWLYRLGFDEPAGNFQQENFSRGGSGGDLLHVEVHDGAAANSAHFTTPPDGIAPRMHLGLYSGLLRDPAFDADILIHEYVHGLTQRLIGGPNSVTGLFRWHSGALAEGWSDALAASFTGEPRFAEYTSRNPETGLRSVAFDESPYTFGEFGTLFAKVVPNTDGRILAVPQIHRDGEIWATVLWDLREKLGAEDFERVIVTALKLTPPRPSMLDARDAILEVDNTGCSLWSVFASRGFGFSAALNPIEEGRQNDTALSVFQSFDEPPACGGASPSLDLVVFEDGAENGEGRWTTTGLWRRTSRRAATGAYSWWLGRKETGTYQTGTRAFGSLVSAPIRLTGLQAAVLEWDQIFRGEGFGSGIDLGNGPSAPYLNADSGRAEITTNGGTTWTTLTTLAHNTPGAGFVRFRINLSRYLGQTVQLKFDFDTFDDQSNDHEGWYIDNIRVRGAQSGVPELAVMPVELEFAAYFGGASPSPQTIGVTSRNGVEADWTATAAEGARWLRLSPASGRTPASVQVSVDAAGLSPGVYHGAVVISTPSTDITQTIAVTLTMAASIEPLASWSFEETGSGGGVTLADPFGGHHGETHGEGSIPIPGVAGRARRLNGAGDFIESPSVAGLFTSSFTLRAWINILSYPENFGVALSAYGGNYRGWYLAVTSEGRVVFLVSHPPGNTRWLISASTLDRESWHAITVTLDQISGTAVLYVDGVAESQQDLPGFEPETNLPLTVGKASWYEGYHLNLAVDETAIFGTAFSAPQVQADFERFSAPPPVPNPSLAAEWNFEMEGADASGNTHHGTLAGGHIIPGVSGSALRLDGQSSFLHLPTSYRLTPSRFTFRAWVRLAAYPARMGVVFANYDGDYRGWYVAVASDGRIVFSLGRLPPQSQWIVTPESLTLGRWHHLAVTYDGALQTAAIYIDGVLQRQATATGLTPQATGAATIGKSSWHNGYYLAADLDEVRLEPLTQTAADIEQDYLAFSAKSHPQPIAAWSFDDEGQGPGTTLTDSSGNAHHAKTAGRGGEPAAGVRGSARRFNGSTDYAQLTPHPDLGSASFSLTAWIKITEHPRSWGTIFSAYSGNYSGWHCGVTADGQLLLSVTGEPASAPWLVSASNLPLGQWSHVAFTFDETSRRGAIYLDGVLIRAAIFPSFTPQATVAPTFGRASWYDGAYLGMALDEARLYTTKLSAQEVLADMQFARE